MEGIRSNGKGPHPQIFPDIHGKICEAINYTKSVRENSGRMCEGFFDDKRSGSVSRLNMG